MFSVKCGNRLEDNAAFCGNCGAKVVPFKVMPIAQSEAQTPVQQIPMNNPQQTAYLTMKQKPSKQDVPPKKRSNLPLIAIVVVLIIVIMLLIGGIIYFFFFDSNDAASLSTHPYTDELIIIHTSIEDETTYISETATTIQRNDTTALTSTEEPTEAETTPSEPTTEAPYTGPLYPEDFIFIDSDSRLLTESDIVGMDEEELQLAINEIYARRGYIFNSERMRAYFEDKVWYRGTIPSSEFSNEIFNYYEQSNIDFLYTAMHPELTEETT